MFRFFCPLCGNKLKATREMIGIDVQCAHCSKVISVPEPNDMSTAEIRPQTTPQDGWAKTQEISRSALRSRQGGDDSVNLVDLINEQVNQDADLDYKNSTSNPSKLPDAAPQKIAVPVEMPPPPDPIEPVKPPSRAPREPSKYRAGMKIGNFEIGRLLGEGAMGQVFAAKQVSMDREVALKILPPETLQQDSDAADQFRNEVKILAKLDHHNIVTAFEAGEDDGVYYLAMAFIKGNSLEELIADGAIVEEEQALNVIIPVANALDYAWSTFNMLHQDVKPANIMLDERGDVKLMDMGIATMATKEAGGQTEAFVLGTPHYMSPEQASGQSNLDWRSDQYSLGCTLYRMVTGEVPFPGDDPSEVMKAHLSAPLTPAKTKNPDLSQEVNDLLKRMLAKTREKRFQMPADLLEALKQAVAASKRHRKAQKNARKETPAASRRSVPKKRMTRRGPRRGGGSYAAKQSGASSGALLIALVCIVLGVYFAASLVNRSGMLLKWGLTFPQQIFLPIFRNDSN